MARHKVFCNFTTRHKIYKMKNCLSTLITIFLSLTLGFQQVDASPLAVFNYKVFYVPGKGPMIETYLDFQGESVILQPDESGALIGQIEIILIFKSMITSEIVAYDKKVLATPPMSETDVVDFIDIQRFAIPAGMYEMEIQFVDLLEEKGNRITSIQEITIPAMTADMFFSDIQLISAFKKSGEQDIFTKSGYDIIPMVSDNFLNPNMSEVIIYGEFYGADKLGADDMFLLTSYIKDVDSGAEVESTRKYERRPTAEVSPFLTRIDITDLQDGRYELVVEARSKDQKLLASQAHFVARTHPGSMDQYTEITPEEAASSWVNRFRVKTEMLEHIRSLRPIASDAELFAMDNTFTNASTLELSYLQQFFYAFWETREENDSEGAWLAYKEQVDIVQKEFGTRNKRGYETDRGRVYLKYGPPADITDRANEPSSYPYQIWRYYKADRWNNVKFIFYDPTLLASDYELLHCDYIPGEIRNPQWKLLLEQRNTPMNNVDRQDGRDHFGGRIDQLFENPR